MRKGQQRMTAAARAALDRNTGRKPTLMPNKTTLTHLKRLGLVHATREEAAAMLNVHRTTLDAFFEAFPEARDAFEDGLSRGRVSLRRAQMKSALGGNPSLLVWLGKNILHQVDRVEVGGEGGLAVTFNILGLPNPQQAISQEQANERNTIDGAAIRLPDPAGNL